MSKKRTPAAPPAKEAPPARTEERSLYGLTMTVPVIIEPWTWQKYGKFPA